MKMEISKEEEISQVSMGKPHVVILGAGASIAAFLNGDKNGKKLPSMLNFVEVLGLGALLDSVGVEHQDRNFEDIYDFISSRPNLADLKGIVA